MEWSLDKFNGNLSLVARLGYDGACTGCVCDQGGASLKEFGQNSLLATYRPDFQVIQLPALTEGRYVSQV